MTGTINLENLPQTMAGRIVGRDDSDYSEVRALYNAMIDKRPAVIAQCESAEDVRAALEWGKANNLLIAVRGGGHNGPGLGSCNDGLLIDLSPMKGIEVDTQARTVRVEPGCTQGDVDRATHPYGLAVPAGIISTTGIAGLTLGGGHGYLSRAYGLTVDNLLSAEVLLADGSIVTANETENEDLFWGLRGGGGNFGIVTSFLFRARPVKDVYGGPIFYDIEQAPQIMRWYRDWLPDAPREMSVFLGLKTIPSTEPFPEELWGRRICALIGCYNGPEADGKEAYRPLREQLPEPLLDGVTVMPFTDLQTLFDPLLPKGLQWYWKGDFVEDLTDEAITAHVEHGGKSPTELSLMHLYPIDGAVHDKDASATPFSARNATWSMVIAGISPEPADAERITKWAKDYWSAVQRFNPGGGYVNFMMDDEGTGRIEAAYGPNYDRLRKIKRKYDPDNVFRVNQNIVP